MKYDPVNYVGKSFILDNTQYLGNMFSELKDLSVMTIVDVKDDTNTVNLRVELSEWGFTHTAALKDTKRLPNGNISGLMKYSHFTKLKELDIADHENKKLYYKILFNNVLGASQWEIDNATWLAEPLLINWTPDREMLYRLWKEKRANERSFF